MAASGIALSRPDKRHAIDTDHWTAPPAELANSYRTSRSTGRTAVLWKSSTQNGRANIGDPILYPGKDDGGRRPRNIVATLHQFVPLEAGGAFVNDADCAVAEPIPEQLDQLVAEILSVGLPAPGAAPPQRGTKVIKAGRTTGLTTGVVRDIHFHFTIEYPGIGEVGFRNQVLCTPYTDYGDSGALVLDKKTKRAVGLHFAGAEGGSVFNPIRPVLHKLGIRLITAPSN